MGNVEDVEVNLEAFHYLLQILCHNEFWHYFVTMNDDLRGRDDAYRSATAVAVAILLEGRSVEVEMREGEGAEAMPLYNMMCWFVVCFGCC